MDIHEFLTSVREAEDLNKYMVQLEKVLIKHPHEIFDLFKLIPKDRNYLVFNWQDHWLYKKIIDLSCLKQGAAYIRLAHSIFHEIPHEKSQLRIASILAASQDDNMLVSELMEDQAKDLLVLVIHELVSRGVDFSQKEAFPKLTEINSQSEFSRLVLYPLSEETYNTFQSYSKDGTSHSFSFGNLKSAYEEVSINETIDIQYEENEEIKMNDFHWVNKSNGKMVNYMGTSSQLVPLGQIIPQLPAFKASKRFRYKKLSPAKAYNHIFEAISKPNAYSDGEYGAKGRLMAWSIIAYLMNVHGYKSNIEVSENMKSFQWYEFNTDAWFWNEWWDLGVFCYHEQSLSFGLIAGTDTD